MNEINIKFKKLHPKGQRPFRKGNADACWDLHSIEDVILRPGERLKVRTGIALAIPFGYAGFLWDRSSMGGDGIHRLAGVIDSNYRGEIIVVLQNLNPVYRQLELFDDVPSGVKEIKAGDRIIQIHICEVNPFVTFEDVGEKSLEETERGDKGFGGQSGK